VREGERQGFKSANGGTIYCFVGSTGKRQVLQRAYVRTMRRADARQRGEKVACLVNTVARTPHKQCVREKKCGTIIKVRTSLDTTVTTKTQTRGHTQHLLAANNSRGQILPHSNFRLFEKSEGLSRSTKGKTQSPKTRTHARLPCQLHHSCPTGHSMWTGL